MVCGPVSGVSALGLDEDDSPDSFAASLEAAIGGNPGGTLVLCDMHGGTPANAAAVLARRRRGVVFASGANLPMVVEAIMAREKLDGALLARVMEAGRAGMASGPSV